MGTALQICDKLILCQSNENGRVVLRRIPDRIDRLLVATKLHRVLCIDRSEIRLDEPISA